MEDKRKVVYLCDGLRCNECNNKTTGYCIHTTDIEHAKNFELMGDVYIEKESEECECCCDECCDELKVERKGYVFKVDGLLKEEDYQRLEKMLVRQYHQGIMLLPKGIKLIDTYEVPNEEDEEIINIDVIRNYKDLAEVLKQKHKLNKNYKNI